jgi:hypothetical protein
MQFGMENNISGGSVELMRIITIGERKVFVRPGAYGARRLTFMSDESVRVSYHVA